MTGKLNDAQNNIVMNLQQ